MEERQYDLAHEISAYQALAEGHRMAPDDEQIYEDMLKARRQMEIAHLQHLHRRQSYDA